MYYGILGTTTAHHDDGVAIALGGARLRALLAALTLRQGRPVPAGQLVDEVWGAEPPQDAAAALQTLVGRLRRTVGRDEIGSGPAGYWLAGRQTDLGDFQRLVAEGRQALAVADHALAAVRLCAALDLWRGPALADLPELYGQAARLEAERDDARRQRIAAELELDRAAELTAELTELCGANPLDEQVQELLIRALRDSGRRAEALQQYEHARRALADQLGADPGSRLRALHRELLGASADGAPKAEQPPGQHLEQLPARHPEQLPARHPEQPPARRPQQPAQLEQPPRPAVRVAGNLRGRLTSFVGRDTELGHLKHTLTTSRLVTLTGPGGSGKTRLSVEAGLAEQGAGLWPDGVWIAELAPLDHPAAVPGAVLSALGLRETVLHTSGSVVESSRVQDPVRRIVEHCAQGRMLLVLDNCEHLIRAAAELADQLLTECPGLTVLATSREPLGVPGETVVPVDPLPQSVAELLLAERGAAARPGFDQAADPAACAEICRRLDGLPLAIELAAARLRGLTPRQIADRLDSRFALLTAGSRTVLPRQQTLRAVVDWSWDLLGKRERAVLRRLSVFAGGWTLEDAEQVCADDAEQLCADDADLPLGTAVPRSEVADLLLSLVDKSLLIADLDAAGPARYRMLETIHEYAAERFAEAAEGEVVLSHLRCFRELVRTADLNLHGPQQLHWLAVLERERDNVRAALRRAVELGEEQEALVLALGMSWFWTTRDYRSEARGWYDQVAALSADPFAEDAPLAEPLTEGPLDQLPPMAAPMLQEARRQLWMDRLMSRFEGNMEVLGDPAAVELARRIVATYHAGLPQSYRLPALARVFAAFLVGPVDDLRPILEEAVEGARLHGRPQDLAFVLGIRSRMLNDWVGGLEQAVRDGDEALEIFTDLGDLWGMSEALSARAESAATLGDTRFAVAAYRRAIELVQQLDAHQDVPMLKVRLGEAMLAEDLTAAEEMVRTGLAEVRPSDSSANGAILYGRMVLCAVHAHRGDFAGAERELDELDAARRVLGVLVPEVVSGMVRCSRAWVAARAGQPERGLELLREGRRTLRTVRDASGVFAEQMTVMLAPAAAGVLLHVAEAAPGSLRSEEAARTAATLLGAHFGLYGRRGSYLARLEIEESERWLRELMGDRAYDAAYAEGGGLSLPETAAMLDALGDW